MSEKVRSTGEQVVNKRTGGFPPAPEPLPVPVFDSHTHLDITIQEGLTSIEAGLEMSTAAGVDRLVQVGVDVESSRWSVEVAADHPAIVSTVALHPNDAPRRSDLDAALREIEDLAAHPRVRGIGETGLDYFRTGEDGRKAQHESFRAHIAISKRYGKALVVHDRDAHDDVLRVLDEEGAPDQVVMHCFSGDQRFALACVEPGFFLSYAGSVPFPNADDLLFAAAVTPIERIMVETGA